MSSSRGSKRIAASRGMSHRVWPGGRSPWPFGSDSCEFTTSGQSDQLPELQHSPSTTASPGRPVSPFCVRTRNTFMWCVPGFWAISKRVT